MFTNIRLKNFKAWGEQLWADGVDLAPITLFLGANSVGKTSLLQPLLLLKQTYASPDKNLDLYLGGKRGDLLDLGSYSQIVYDHQEKTELAFGFEMDEVKRFMHWLHLPEPSERPSGISDQDWVEVNTHAGDVRGPLSYRVSYGSAARTFHLNRLQIKHAGMDLKVSRSAKGAYRIESPLSLIPVETNQKSSPKREFKPINSLRLSEASKEPTFAENFGVDDLILEVLNAFEDLQYLGPLREPPRPSYIWSAQDPGEIGTRGEDSVYRLLANLLVGKKAERGYLINEVSYWLNRMGVADSLTIEQLGKSRFFEVLVNTGNKTANLIHVGFGVSQVLPMIVLAYTAPEGSTIIVEQPEIHLHPSAQSELADLMIHTATARKLQFLVETHSEHLFRRMQTLVADPESPASDKTCAMHFVSRSPEGEAAVTRLVLDEYGRIQNWPERFFGDSIGETERQMSLMLERMMKGAGSGR